MLATSVAFGDETPTAFIESYCIECHLSDDPSGEREFETLDWARSDFDTQISVQEIIDQLTLGTMPPEDGDQPTTAQRLAAIETMTARLADMRATTSSTNGKTVLRRLSRREYRRTVGDLLSIDMTMFDPTLEFPADNLDGHFDNVGDAMVMSGHLLERYLDAADRCVQKALFVDEEPTIERWHFRDGFFQQAELKAAHKAAFQEKFLCLYDHPLNDKPEGAYGHVRDFKNGVPVDGIYEVRVLVKAMHRDTPYGNKAVRIDLDEPFRLGIRPGDTSIGDMVHRQPIQPLLAEAVVPENDFEWVSFRVPLDKGFAPRFTFENGIHDVRGSFGRVYRLHRDSLPEKARKEEGIFKQRIAVIRYGQMPHIRIDEVQIRGPIDLPWPTKSQRALLGDQPWDPKRVDSLIEQFATRAFRRPATENEVADLLALYQRRVVDGREPIEAYSDAVKAILCSPAFLYFQPPNADGGLTDHALAERLSYFLTSSMPDATLRRLADEGALNHRKTLRQQARRLLESEASDAFVADFLDGWLNLRSLGSMPPDPSEFWFFYAGDLEHEMKIETRMFFRDLIERNASLTEMVDAKHSFLNRDLAKLYGVTDQIPLNDAATFRRVDFLRERTGRGGLLGQASVLTVSANGIETSPVVRGVWMLENILGTPTPPPPDDVPTIEPDTRGAKTIRDQLTKHRENAACFQCHRKIDPLGFAMETFDAIGQFRKFYDSKRKQPIDSSGVLPGGDAFADLNELKTQLMARQAFFARTVTLRLLTHALGRRIEPLDRADVDTILASVEADDYPLADLIESIVTSDLFQH